MPTSFAPIGAILKRVGHRFGLDIKLLEFHLRRRWPDVVGEQIAAHTRPDQIRFRKLYLVAESSVWLQQLSFLKPTLVDAINAAANGQVISDIVLRVGEVGDGHSKREKGEREQRLPQEPAPQPDVIEEAAAHAQAVKDPGLRDLLTTVMARLLSLPARATKSDPRQPERSSRSTPSSPNSQAP